MNRGTEGRDGGQRGDAEVVLWEAPTKGLARERTLLIARALLAADRYVYFRVEDGPERYWTILESCQLVRSLPPEALGMLWRDYAAGGDRRACAVALLKYFKRSWAHVPDAAPALVAALRTIPDDLKGTGDARHQIGVVRWVEGTVGADWFTGPTHPAALRRLYRAAQAIWGIRVTPGGPSTGFYGPWLLSDPAFAHFLVEHADHAEQIAALMVDRGCREPEELSALLASAAPAGLLAGAL